MSEKTLALASADANDGVRVAVDEPSPRDGTRRVTLQDGRVQLAAARPPADEPRSMSDPGHRGDDATMQLPAFGQDGQHAQGARLAEDLAELPLLVRVELGTATLSAREWSTMGAGDTLVLEGRVGDPVTLRIGGRALARGELVDVDGAIGVRITERLA